VPSIRRITVITPVYQCGKLEAGYACNIRLSCLNLFNILNFHTRGRNRPLPLRFTPTNLHQAKRRLATHSFFLLKYKSPFFKGGGFRVVDLSIKKQFKMAKLYPHFEKGS
jgi:hypothetical protein